jgi:hypothetical protein
MRHEARGVNPPNLIDRSLKVLIRRVAPAFFRLAGVSVDPATISPGDVSVNLCSFCAKISQRSEHSGRRES